MAIPKNKQEFQESLEFKRPPQLWPEALKALWYDAKGNWEASHDIAQEIHDHLGSWIHAYLHRKEGDRFNAGYWYRRAGKTFPKVNLEEEHLQLVEFVLNSN